MKAALLLLLALLALAATSSSAEKSDVEKYNEYEHSYVQTALRQVTVTSRQYDQVSFSDAEDDDDFDQNRRDLNLLTLAWSFCPLASRVRISNLYGIVTAFAPEAVEVVSKLTGNVEQVDIAGRRFFLGRLDGKRVVVVASGVGTNNAALTTQLLLDHFRVSKLFFSGIAGGVNPAHRVGDVIVAEKWGNYHYQKYIRAQAGTRGFTDTSTTFPNTFFRDDNGNVVTFTRPSCTNCDASVDGLYPGFAVPMFTEVLRNGGDAYLTDVPEQFWFPVSANLLDAAQDAIAAGITLTNTGRNPITGQNFTLPYTPTVSVGPAGISSSTFVDNAEIRTDYFETFHADVLDMESAAFMQVCEQNQGIQCLVVRSLSDLAGGDENINVILTFVNFAAKNSVTVLRAILAQL